MRDCFLRFFVGYATVAQDKHTTMLYHTLLCRLEVHYVDDLSSAGDIKFVHTGGIALKSPSQHRPQVPLPFLVLSLRDVFLGEHFARFCKQKASHDATSPSLGWFHPFRDFVRRKDHEGCTALDLALKVPHEAFDVSPHVFHYHLSSPVRQHGAVASLKRSTAISIAYSNRVICNTISAWCLLRLVIRGVTASIYFLYIPRPKCSYNPVADTPIHFRCIYLCNTSIYLYIPVYYSILHVCIV